jgi:hypothetical protein
VEQEGHNPLESQLAYSLGAKSGAITTDGAMVFGAGAESGDLTRTNGKITFGADAKSGAIPTTYTGAVVYGIGAESGISGNECCGSFVCSFDPSISAPSTAPSSSPSALPSHSHSVVPPTTPSGSPISFPSSPLSWGPSRSTVPA